MLAVRFIGITIEFDGTGKSIAGSNKNWDPKIRVQAWNLLRTLVCDLTWIEAFDAFGASKIFLLLLVCANCQNW